MSIEYCKIAFYYKNCITNVQDTILYSQLSCPCIVDDEFPNVIIELCTRFKLSSKLVLKPKSHNVLNLKINYIKEASLFIIFNTTLTV